MTIEIRAKELLDEGLSLAKVRATLTLEDYSPKDIIMVTKGSGSGTGFEAEFRAYIIEAERTEAELIAFITEKGTESHLKGKGYFLKLAKLASDIRATYK